MGVTTMGIIIMTTGGDPLEPRATPLLPMMRTVDTAPEAEADPDPDLAGRAAGIETMTVEPEPEPRSSSRDGAA